MSIRPSDPHWTADVSGDADTLISGNARCRVWRSMGSWNAVASHRGDATAAYDFTTLEDAQQWCERLIAERKRQ